MCANDAVAWVSARAERGSLGRSGDGERFGRRFGVLDFCLGRLTVNRLLRAWPLCLAGAGRRLQVCAGDEIVCVVNIHLGERSDERSSGGAVYVD